MKIKQIMVITLSILALTACDNIGTKKKITSLTPMECTHVVSSYKWRLTKKENVEIYNDGVKIKNEIDGKYLYFTQKDESSYACEILGEEIKYES